MSLKLIMRKMLLAFFLGWRATLGIGMRREEIEEILYSNNQARVEATIPEENDKGDSSSPLRPPVLRSGHHPQNAVNEFNRDVTTGSKTWAKPLKTRNGLLSFSSSFAGRRP
jgi:hypothetical protein